MTNHPDHDTIRAALGLAVRAPSVHNTQPWLWRLGADTVHLYADTARHLPHTDPDQRDLIMSCGAALQHFRVAAQVFGWETLVHRLPNPADPNHLAAVEFRSGVSTPEAVRMARGIARRRTDRRRYTSWEVPAAFVSALVDAGVANGVLVRDIDSGSVRARLLDAFEQAASHHAGDFSYGTELSRWSGRHATPEGVPARSAVVATDPTVRPFANPGLRQAVISDVDADARLLLLSTTSDDRISCLRAGEAAGAVLLTATSLGLATCPLTEPLEVRGARDYIRTEVLGDSGFPQLIIRFGFAATSADPVPRTPRRPIDEIVRPL
ncbi:Acg family FMN-binding oxidoreductase [Nocardia wallacei]|uniref:NAD(P)H nitroreductase n=1 Tax=Nocardia wallacei TaxID=480035 RepID=A0A7G1KLF4_9NOCA|nr:nitroreductase family protein [Nocardia wallacei]BCK56032.1 NAD(P)H nitroreductase [Nocardia wallacei]